MNYIASQTVHNDSTSLAILMVTLFLIMLLSLLCPLLLANFVAQNNGLLLDGNGWLKWPRRTWLLILGMCSKCAKCFPWKSTNSL